MFRKLTFAGLFFYGFHSPLQAQIAANPTSGCAPLVGVSFTGIPGATGILWNFNDGGTSPLINPVHTFSNPGTYTVSFTATVAGNPVSQNISIQVFHKPSPNFTAITSPLNGCAPLNVGFSDFSTGGGGTGIVSWEWAFGDGGFDTTNATMPNYTYVTQGLFDVTLKVTDQNGCDSSTVIQNYITVSLPPTVIISSLPTPATACNPPFNVFFYGTGSQAHCPLGNALTYNWNFMNGNTSAAATPGYQQYSSYGVFPVSLILTDLNNCSDTAIKNVTVAGPQALFAIDDTICRDHLFQSLSTGNLTQVWDFGDGTGNTNVTHFHNYPPGSAHYNVKLTVTNGSCIDDTTVSIFVEEPEPDFTVSPGYMCDLPTTVNITNLSTGATSYSWYFDDSFSWATQHSLNSSAYYNINPQTSNAVNPSFTINVYDTNRYSFHRRDYMISISLTATTSHGCMKSITKDRQDTIYIPTARYMPTVVEGCVPLSVTFLDSSASNEAIINWEYNFGDGTFCNGPVPDTTHVYALPGIYSPVLIITNAAGCIDTSYVIPIRVGALPNPDFSVSATTICVGDSIQFTNLTPPTDSVSLWHYSADGGFFFSSCPQDASPHNVFAMSTGTQSISLEACSNGCCNTITKTNAIQILGPWAQFHVEMFCDSSRVYKFTADTSDADYWTWDFGDGTVINNSTLTTISHTYLSTGNYIAVLTAYNASSGCAPATDTIPVKVRDINAAFSAPLTGCAGTGVVYNAGASVDVNAVRNGGYVWLWDDGTHPDITGSHLITHTFPVAGFHDVRLVVKDVNGCRDTIHQLIKTYEVNTVDFISSQTYVCVRDTITFSGFATSDTTITGYSWDFGDGGFSSLQNPTHIFNTFNPTITEFDVTLTAINVLGCFTAITKPLYISRPSAAFFLIGDLTMCVGDSIKLQSQNTYSYMHWSFGDGHVADNGPVIYHTYMNAGTYTTSLSIRDSIGCTDTKTKINQIKVQDMPHAYITTPADTATQICYPYQGIFTDTSVNNNFGSRVWDLGTGQPINNTLSTVGLIYQLPGVYHISLVTLTTFGCSDTASKTLVVNGPLVDFTLSKQTICLGQDISFGLVDTFNVFSYHWDFGDGVDTNDVAPIAHTYNFVPPGGSTNVSIVAYSDNYSCPKAVTKPISILKVKSDFMRNLEATPVDTAHCIGIPDNFLDQSLNADVFSWNFGDGGTSTKNNISHLYSGGGTYDVNLAITNNITGCTDSKTKKIRIFDLPVVTTGDVNTCKGKPAKLLATGGKIYLWHPSLGLDAANIPNPSASPAFSTYYSVLVTDSNNCSASDTAFVFVQQPPPQIIWDTSLVIGQRALLQTTSTTDFRFVWSPIDSLSCTDCPAPVANPSVDTRYRVVISDTMGCFNLESYFDVTIKPFASVDIPSAFTPNGDGVNDIVYVDGWGIKRLLEFKIYNRWGELLFETDNISVGWDGTYQGVQQNIETYAYYVRVETYVDEVPLAKKGYVKLLR